MSLWTAPYPLVLASGSRIRRQLLENAGIPLEIRPADIDERAVETAAGDAPPAEIAQALALAKGASVAAGMRDRIVLAADQTMACGSRVYHKPSDRAAAHEQIASLLGRTHELHAAVAVFVDGEPRFQHCETARLAMRDASPSFIDRYLDLAGEAAFSSVGGYQLEGIGIHLFERIEGDYFTILGLPMLSLLRFLQKQQYVME
jgi:septum formation protein